MKRGRLSDSQVKAIRLGYDAGISMEYLAEKYKLSISMVSLICAGKRYAHVEPHKSTRTGCYEGHNRGRPPGGLKLGEVDILRMKLFRKRGYSYRDLERIFKVSPATCLRYCRRNDE
jgi:hypothetical protein